ncbi:MAG: hypothetical protein WCJ46_03330 [bacterium]
MRKQAVFVLILTLSLTFFSGCFSSFNRTPLNALKLSSYPAANLSVLTSEALSLTISASEINSFRELLSADISHKKLFKDFYIDSAVPVALYINVEIISVKLVSPADRTFLIFWTNDSEIKVLVTLTDANTGALVDKFNTEGQATNSGSIEEAIKYCVWNITAYFSSNK